MMANCVCRYTIYPVNYPCYAVIQYITRNYDIIPIGPKGPNFSRHWKKWDYIYYLNTKIIFPLSASSQSSYGHMAVFSLHSFLVRVNGHTDTYRSALVSKEMDFD